MEALSRAVWRKSSRSGSNGGDCVEVAFLDAAWRKSSRSGDNGGDCVEVAVVPDAVAVRDSKDPTGPVLVVAPDRWAAFLAGVRAGDFDLG